MTLSLIFEILGLGVGIAKQLTTGGANKSVNLAGGIVDIARKAAEAYQSETGEPLDWNKINRIEPIA